MKCFEYNKKCNLSCQKKTCRYWIDLKNNQNCCINAAKDESESKFTLQDIGNIFNVTRMRICQIEKMAIKKIKEKINL
jgi:DNA-directed RNA polymerase specialized sigma subunit